MAFKPVSPLLRDLDPIEQSRHNSQLGKCWSQMIGYYFYVFFSVYKEPTWKTLRIIQNGFLDSDFAFCLGFSELEWHPGVTQTNIKLWFEGFNTIF